MKHSNLESNWDSVKGQLKQRFAQLTDDDMAFVAGKGEELLARLRRKLELSEHEFDALIEELKANAVSRVELAQAKAADFAEDVRARVGSLVEEVKVKGAAAAEEVKAQAGVAYDEARARVPRCGRTARITCGTIRGKRSSPRSAQASSPAC